MKFSLIDWLTFFFDRFRHLGRLQLKSNRSDQRLSTFGRMCPATQVVRISWSNRIGWHLTLTHNRLLTFQPLARLLMNFSFSHWFPIKSRLNFQYKPINLPRNAIRAAKKRTTRATHRQVGDCFWSNKNQLKPVLLNLSFDLDVIEASGSESGIRFCVNLTVRKKINPKWYVEHHCGHTCGHISETANRIVLAPVAFCFQSSN